MIRVLFHDERKSGYVDEYDTLSAAVAEMREYWHEDKDHKLMSFRDDSGVIQATMQTGDTSDHCVTTYRSGKVEIHLIHYRFDDEGKYTHTDVQRIG